MESNQFVFRFSRSLTSMTILKKHSFIFATAQEYDLTWISSTTLFYSIFEFDYLLFYGDEKKMFIFSYFAK